MHLSHKEIGRRHQIQKCWMRDVFAGSITTELLVQLIILKILLVTSAINPHQVRYDIVVDFLIQLAAIQHDECIDRVTTWFQLDHLLHDIDPLESIKAGLPFRPHMAITLDCWDDCTSNKYTSFLRGELGDIYRLFGLADRVGSDGLLRIPSGSYTRGKPDNYKIHPEELFLFFMTRCRKNWPLVDMVDQLFGGWVSRWYHAWPWMLSYLDRRYRNILGHQGLLRFRDQFPEFFAAIERQASSPVISLYTIFDTGILRTEIYVSAER